MPVAATSTRPNKATVVAVRLAPQDTAAIDALASRTEMRQYRPSSVVIARADPTQKVVEVRRGESPLRARCDQQGVVAIG